MLFAHVLGLTMPVPGGFSVSVETVAGGALLGLGAWLNNACVFGTVSRIGNGEISYVAAFPGFLTGFLFGVWFMGPMKGAGPPVEAPVLAPALPFGVVAAAVVPGRIIPPLLRRDGVTRLWADLMQPAAATRAIGVLFVGCVLTLGFG